jgi:hypothetical protein
MRLKKTRANQQQMQYTYKYKYSEAERYHCSNCEFDICFNCHGVSNSNPFLQVWDSLFDVRNVKSLTLRGSLPFKQNNSYEEAFQGDATLETIWSSSSSLTTLKIINGFSLNSKPSPRGNTLDLVSPFSEYALTQLAFRCPTLTELDFSGSSTISVQTLIKMVKHLPNLLALYISDGFACGLEIGMADAGEEEVKENGCDTSLRDLEQLLPHCLQLLHFDMGSNSGEFLDDISAIKHCTALTYLDISHAFEVTKSSFEIICTNCTKLTSINLIGCELILSNGGVQLLAQHCTGLASLSIGPYPENDDAPSESSTVDDVDIHSIAHHFPNLRELAVHDSPLITDFGLKVLADYCTALTTLDISGCVRSGEISDEGLFYLRKCTSLTSLVLGEAQKRVRGYDSSEPGVSCLALTRFRSSNPGCSIACTEWDDY